jgi:hypothetical protein
VCGAVVFFFATFGLVVVSDCAGVSGFTDFFAENKGET